MARLVLLSEGFTGRTYELKTDKTTIGRVADNTFEIPEQSVSSHHCEILLRGGEVYIKDLESTNGTFINGEKISEGALKAGQILRLGTIEMRLEAGASPATSPAAQKKLLDQTRVIPQGIKLDDLQGDKSTNFEGKTGFEKKSNTPTILFITSVIAVGLILVGLLIYMVVKTTR